MNKIQTLNNISPVGLDKLPRERYEVSSEIANPDAILVRSAKMHTLEIGNNLKAVGRAGAGVNNIPLDKMSEKGVVVFNAPGANANAVKELVISSMLLASRNICQAWNYVNNLPLDNLKTAIEDGKKNYAGSELPGKTLGIVGLGAIGVQIANAANALGMRVIGFDPSITIKSAWKLSADVEQALSVDELFAQSDFVSFHVPLVAGTKNLLNETRIALLPAGATILNFARDGIVDEEALMVALEAGKVKYYVTDFPIDDKKNHDRVIALPHLGASTAEAEDNCAIMVANQVKDYLENGNILNSVNFPEAKMPRVGEFRLAITHQNIPNMVGQISTILADAKINIIDMLNKSREEVAYTLIDIESGIPDAVVDNLKQVKGILSVRAL
ncbi:D-3-phosphoglycerate dehydrogenase [Bathymodiolus thermophilus thioautotrophic gill symbiont]|uniref:D-3-phosphoglycerate dehydrogenase n=1 Tax=Bathymodiolus thermophilus thioautotrophic gill symbiont TaxID=2360 RepID=A0A3G3ILN5_9GAMM|nr:phosphoglycerate dehydrogenase [Bathymodiolus thermophilus thioautotrophic gill symbiont]AYQ56639.1 Phosphoglycerate dehydrogenase [Bathymodiolus thermophilus thioautotrophic gill symbiont]SHA25214.1 D-3-phosphoglycerate dehydrogenase [Bathymodiolus thermophilus thioautotrophic gill symbiont]